MPDVLEIAGISIQVTKKKIKNLHLTVHPPAGSVRISAPLRMDLDAIRMFAISKLPWIRQQQAALAAQERETQREYLDQESHYVWGNRYLLKRVDNDVAPHIYLTHRYLVLVASRGISEERMEAALAFWYREQIREVVAPLQAKWEPLVGAKVQQLFVQRMKTRWGSCNPQTGTVRLNTELAKKPPCCLEYILVHELVHMLEPNHGPRFQSLMDGLMPNWRHLRDELNRAPLAHEDWEA